MDFELDVAAVGTEVVSGILRVFYAERSDFTTIASPPASPVDPQDAVVISTAHTPIDADHGFRECYISQEKSELEMEGKGDADGMATMKTVKIFIPGDKKSLFYFLFRNPKLLLLVEKAPCGGSEYYQVGNKCTAAKIRSWKWASKKIDGSDSKGAEIEVGCTMDRPLLYTAAIPLAAA